MRLAQLFLPVVLTGLSGSSIAAQTIFNIQPPVVQKQEQQVQVGRLEQMPQFNPSSPVDIKSAAQQFDRRPDESNEAYQVRMNALSKRAMEDMERASRAHNERMKALAPK